MPDGLTRITDFARAVFNGDILKTPEERLRRWEAIGGMPGVKEIGRYAAEMEKREPGFIGRFGVIAILERLEGAWQIGSLAVQYPSCVEQARTTLLKMKPMYLAAYALHDIAAQLPDQEQAAIEALELFNTEEAVEALESLADIKPHLIRPIVRALHKMDYDGAPEYDHEAQFIGISGVAIQKLVQRAAFENPIIAELQIIGDDKAVWIIGTSASNARQALKILPVLKAIDTEASVGQIAFTGYFEENPQVMLTAFQTLLDLRKEAEAGRISVSEAFISDQIKDLANSLVDPELLISLFDEKNMEHYQQPVRDMCRSLEETGLFEGFLTSQFAAVENLVRRDRAFFRKETAPLLPNDVTPDVGSP